MADALFWVRHNQLVWAPCKFKKQSGATSYYVYQEVTENGGKGKEEEVEVDASTTPEGVFPEQLTGVENICHLESVNQGALLHTVRVRYSRTDIYTCVSRVLIAVNPFRPLEIYEDSYLKKYLEVSDSQHAKPHIFGIGVDAMQGLKSQHKHQAVLVSGESGSGKTESTKLVLSYIVAKTTAAAGNDNVAQLYEVSPPKQRQRSRSRYSIPAFEPNIQDRIMQTNPILESFGNAMTVRNNNSSRFGKWVQMHISSKLQIAGCSITDYLLELTRVVSQSPKERNYHVFFQLLYCKDDEKLKDLKIKSPSEYNYTKKAMLKAPRIDDTQTFVELQEAFRLLGFTPESEKDAYRTVVGILTLGNIEFTEKQSADGTTAAQFASEQTVRDAEELLGMSAGVLDPMLTVKRREVRGEVTEAPLSAATAASTRDAFARLLYGRLFKWLVMKINDKLSDNGESTDPFVGLLDIAGFESFETNSLEQLMINLSNEHLQSHFNNQFFKMEIEEYKNEGVDMSFVQNSVSFEDNADILLLIDSKKSILSMLDDEVSIPKATDQTLLNKLFKEFEAHVNFQAPKNRNTRQFGVKHFAGTVTYSADGFLEKNVDRPPDEATGCMEASSLPVLQEISKLMKEENSSTGAPGRRKVKTVSSGFRTSLASLMDKLRQAEPHFIRCIKPNHEKVANIFTSDLVMHQLTYSGVLEAVRIRQAGYASRIAFDEFVEKYALTIPAKVREGVNGSTAPADAMARAKAFIAAIDMPMSAGDIVLGSTKVFAKNKISLELDKRKMQILQDIRSSMEGAIESRSINDLELALTKCEGLMEHFRSLHDQVTTILEEERRKEEVRAEMREAMKTEDSTLLRRAIEKCQQVGLPQIEIDEAQATLKEWCKKWAVQRLEKALETRQLQTIRDAIEEAELGGLQETDLAPARKILDEEEKKAAARAELADAVQGRDILSLKQAIGSCEKLGIPAGEVDPARKALAEEERKASARVSLAEAVQQRDVAALRTAIQEGVAAGLDASDLAAGKQALEEEERKVAARSALAAAVQSRQVDGLRVALKEGEESGLSESELEGARNVLSREEARIAARAAAEAACTSRELPALREAITQGESAGLDPKELEAARRALREEEGKEKTREVLLKAIDSRSMDELRKAMAAGREVGLSEVELGRADVVYKEEERKEHARERLKVVCRGREIEQIREALEEAEASGLEISEMANAREVLGKELGKCQALDVLQDACQDRSIEKLRAALAQGEAAGLDSSQLAAAKRALKEEESKEDTRRTLEAAVASREIPKLRLAIAQGQKVGLRASELAFGEQTLAQEERKVAARKGLTQAMRSCEIQVLREAIDEAESAGLGDDEVEPVREVLATEQGKEHAMSTLEEACRLLDISELEAALAQAKEAGIARRDLESAEKILSREIRKQEARQKLEAAVGDRTMNALRSAISEGEAAGLDVAELQFAQDALMEEERKVAARTGLQEAMANGTIEELEAAIREGQDAGLEANECADAGRILERKQFEETVRVKLREAVACPNVIELSAVIQTAEEAGMTCPELNEAREVLACEEGKLAAIHAVEQAQEEDENGNIDTEVLHAAIRGCLLRGIDEIVVTSARARLKQELEKQDRTNDWGPRFSDARDRILPIARTLTFELAWRSAQHDGFGALDWKVAMEVPEQIVVCDASKPAAFVQMVEQKCASKANQGILMELCTNLRSCVIKDGLPVGIDSLAQLPGENLAHRQMLRTCLELQWRSQAAFKNENLAGAFPVSALQFPLALFSMLLFTQQEVDVDRMLLFPDVPAIIRAGTVQGSSQVASCRSALYQEYRARVAGEAAGSNAEQRNVVPFGLLSAAALTSWAAFSQDKVNQAADDAMGDWVRWMCLLGALRQRFEKPFTVSRVLTNTSPELRRLLQDISPGQDIFWPAPLSTTLDARISEYYCQSNSSGVENVVLLEISGVSEGLELFRVSQYPQEHELLLPPCTLLRVGKVITGDGQPLRLRCKYVGTLQSKENRDNCLFDLVEASQQLASAAGNPKKSAAKGRLDRSPSPGRRVLSPGRGGGTNAPSSPDEPSLVSPVSPREHAASGRLEHARPWRAPTRLPGVSVTSSTLPGMAGSNRLYARTTFSSLFSVFEAMDRRGVFAISREDFRWAQQTLSNEFKRLVRINNLCAHFFRSSDLTLHRFLCLSMPGLAEAETDRYLRLSLAKLRERVW